jgi:hypothetical protein
MGFSKTLVPNPPKYLVLHYGSRRHCCGNLKSHTAYASCTFLGTLELGGGGGCITVFSYKIIQKIFLCFSVII